MEKCHRSLLFPGFSATYVSCSSPRLLAIERSERLALNRGLRIIKEWNECKSMRTVEADELKLSLNGLADWLKQLNCENRAITIVAGKWIEVKIKWTNWQAVQYFTIHVQPSNRKYGKMRRDSTCYVAVSVCPSIPTLNRCQLETIGRSIRRSHTHARKCSFDRFWYCRRAFTINECIIIRDGISSCPNSLVRDDCDLTLRVAWIHECTMTITFSRCLDDGACAHSFVCT